MYLNGLFGLTPLGVLRELHKFTGVFMRLPLWFLWKPASVCLCCFSITDEAGASIYSVSPEAVKEMPDMDPNLRSAGNLHIPSFHTQNYWLTILVFLSVIMQIYGMEFKDVEWDIHKKRKSKKDLFVQSICKRLSTNTKTENVYQPLVDKVIGKFCNFCFICQACLC